MPDTPESVNTVSPETAPPALKPLKFSSVARGADTKNGRRPAAATTTAVTARRRRGPEPGTTARAGSTRRMANCLVTMASPNSAPARTQRPLIVWPRAPRARPRPTMSCGWKSCTMALLAAGRKARKTKSPASRSGVSTPAARTSDQRASRQRQPAEHAQQPLSAVPRRRDVTRAGWAERPAFVDVAGEVRIVRVRALLVQRGSPARGEAPRRRTEQRRKGGHERRGEERIAGRVGQSVLGGGCMQLP